MPGMFGVELLLKIRSECPDTSVVLVTAFGTVESATDTMKVGAFEYITKPVNPDSLRLIVGRALEHLSLRESLRHALDQRAGFENIVGRSRSLLGVLEQAARAAQSDVTVLIRCETGTGKELVAQGIRPGYPGIPLSGIWPARTEDRQGEWRGFAVDGSSRSGPCG